MACQPLLFDIWFPRYESLKILDLAFRKGETASTWGARVGGASHILKKNKNMQQHLLVHEILKNNKSNTQNATKTTKTTCSLKKCLFANESKFLRIHIGKKGQGPYLKIIGIWGHIYGVLIPGIALVAGPHQPENSAEKIFLHRF